MVMSDWSIDYHQVLQYRLFALAALVGLPAIGGALGCGLRIGCRLLARQTMSVMTMWQRRTP
jgi:hypothetical protein